MRKIEEILVDDLDGSRAVETIDFAIRKTEYEIDLSDENTQRFWSAIGPFMEHARRIVRKRAQPSTLDQTRAVWVNAKKVRAWARSVGMEVNSQGTVQTDVQEAFLRAWLDKQIPEEYL